VTKLSLSAHTAAAMDYNRGPTKHWSVREPLTTSAHQLSLLWHPMKTVLAYFVGLIAPIGFVIPCSPIAAAESKPNILLIIADDCTYRDLEVYGGQARTPTLNRLAQQGLKFQHCFQAAPMCSPTRHCLYTGLYPVKSGAYPNHTLAYDWVRSIAHYLQEAGYSTHLSGKTHINPKAVFPFQYSGNNNPDPAALAAVIKESTTTKQPFLFIAASNEPHTPWNLGDPSQYPPDDLQLPPVLVDTSDTREGFSKYLAEITYFDSQVGELVGLLDQSPLKDNTLVMVLSEQGNSFPFAKWTCYDVGLQSACIVRWPGKVKPGEVSGAFIEYVDVVPTFLEAAGAARPEILDGQSFVPVLTGAARTHKTYVFGLQTTRGINNGSEFFGIRSVRDDRYRYILNLTPEETFQNAATHDPTFKTWEKMATAGDAKAQRLVHAYQHRPAEELYDCQADPWNQHNLAHDPRYSQQLGALRTQLAAWMKQQGDAGQATEMLALERMPKHSKEAGDAPSEGKTRPKKKAAQP
jgi:N-sulfoglucosamine sulfohydrolase